jgi:hypothetical protein
MAAGGEFEVGACEPPRRRRQPPYRRPGRSARSEISAHKELEDMTTEMTPQVLGEATLGELEQGLRGQLIRPSDEAYVEACTVWNGARDRRPALIVRCAGVADVMCSVEFARREDLLVAVRGGGHSIPGFSTCDGGMVVDLNDSAGTQVAPSSFSRFRFPTSICLVVVLGCILLTFAAGSSEAESRVLCVGRFSRAAGIDPAWIFRQASAVSSPETCWRPR